MGDSPATDVQVQPAKPKGRFWVWPVAIIALLVGGWYGYQRWSFEKKHVYTDNAQVQGRIVKILSPETGYVEKLPVENNDPVKRGDLLAKLSDDFYQWEVQRAQAQFNILQSQQGSDKNSGLSQAQMASAQANLEVVQSQLAEAKSAADKAQQAYNRKLSEFNTQNISQNQLDMSKSSLDEANARLLTLQKEAYAAQQQVNEAVANSHLVGYGLDSAKAELEQAKQRLNYTQIKSPLDGVVAKQVVEPGVLVEPGQYLMSVVSLSDVWIVANIKEDDFLRVKHGATVNITIDAFPGQVFQGVVNSTSPATGSMFSLIPKDNASGNFIKVPALIPVRIDFVGLPQAQYRLLPGMSAEVTIEVLEADKDVSTTVTKEAAKEAAPAPTDAKSAPEATPAKPATEEKPAEVAKPDGDAKPEAAEVDSDSSASSTTSTETAK